MSRNNYEECKAEEPIQNTVTLTDTHTISVEDASAASKHIYTYIYLIAMIKLISTSFIVE